jgi:hypothetical protein
VNGPLSEQAVLGRRCSRTGHSAGEQVTGWGGSAAAGYRTGGPVPERAAGQVKNGSTGASAAVGQEVQARTGNRTRGFGTARL